MKKKIIGFITAFCDKCHNPRQLKDLYRFSWRYNDKKRTYKDSKRYIIHTGYDYVCKKCLNKIINSTFLNL